MVVMKPLYILDRYDESSVRRQRATLEEIRAVVDGKSSERLATIAIGDDGDIVATQLVEADLATIRAELNVEHERRIRELLDASLGLCRKARGIDGVSVGLFGAITFWLDGMAPGTDDIALAWAAEHTAEIRRNSPPRDPHHWCPDAEIKVDGIHVCRLVWPEREANTEKAINDEIATVAAERSIADSELADIAEAF